MQTTTKNDLSALKLTPTQFACGYVPHKCPYANALSGGERRTAPLTPQNMAAAWAASAGQAWLPVIRFVSADAACGPEWEDARNGRCAVTWGWEDVAKCNAGLENNEYPREEGWRA